MLLSTQGQCLTLCGSSIAKPFVSLEARSPKGWWMSYAGRISVPVLGSAYGCSSSISMVIRERPEVVNLLKDPATQIEKRS